MHDDWCQTDPLPLHGGDWASYQRKHGAMPLDFSASVSPLGLPPAVRAAAVAALDDADRYPDPSCAVLRGALAREHAVVPSWVLCGNGAADLIYRLVYALKPVRALLCAPTFAEYACALGQVGCAVDYLLLSASNDFALPVHRLLEAEGVAPDLVVLCEPNNPTGRTTPRDQLERVFEHCARTQTTVLVDECFNDFLDDPAAHTVVPLLGRYPNVVVLKAFTKLYAMAGLRLGYALCSNEGFLAALERAGAPWGVSAVAQAAGLAALEARDYREAVRALVREERPYLAAALEDLGCWVIPGEANYLLFWCREPRLRSLLELRGILVRDCANFRGLGPGWYRVAVRTRAHNDRLLAAIREVLPRG